ncbi:MAG: prepilin-type N-terminal cleavage/methylation domain-containing protein [Bacteroidales bacterium]|nr:prepilin-type N-terminal cleavage/methylation domain-containing protein [Bacteroidales bacterium]
MENISMKASTLPELLVTMVVGGILLLIIFDGVDMIRRSIGTGDLMDFGEELSLLEEREILEDRSDSIVLKDSVCLFFRNGEIIKTLDNDVQEQ